MENPEEILQCLEEFSKIKPKDIPRELEEYLCFVAKTGNPVYQWPVIKCLFRQKLINVIGEFYETCPAIDIPPCLNVDLFNYNTMKTFILEKLDTFVAAPFTVQRICELLTTPRKQYNRIDKYMRALEKNILVVSTTEPVYRSTENGENNNQAIVNGLESDHLSSASSDDTPNINIEEMDDTPPHTTSPPTTWSTPNRNNTITQQPNASVSHTPPITIATEHDPEQEEDNASSTEGSTSDDGEILPQTETGITAVEEEAGSSEEDEEEERLLLSATDKESDIHGTVDGEQVRISTIVANSAPADIPQSAPLISSLDATEAATVPVPVLHENGDSAEEISEIVTEPPEVALIEAADSVLVEGILVGVRREDKDVNLNVTDKDGVIVDGGSENERVDPDGDSDNMSDIKPELPTENLTESIAKLPNENLETFPKTDEISAETLTVDISPEEPNLFDVKTDIDVKTDSEEQKIDVKTNENRDVIDKDADAEKHDTSDIVKEAEELEKEITQMENIPEIKIDEKRSENAEKIKIDEVKESENVEEDERMEIDQEILPDLIEATSTSL